MEAKDEIQVSEKLSQRFIGEVSSSSCTIPQEDEAASTNQETSSLDSASVIVEEPQENIQQQEEENKPTKQTVRSFCTTNSTSQSVALEEEYLTQEPSLLEIIYVVWNNILMDLYAIVNAINTVLYEKVCAFVALEEICAATEVLSRSLDYDLVVCQQKGGELSKNLEDYTLTRSQSKRRNEALDRCNYYASVLKLAVRSTRKEHRILSSILFEVHTKKGLRKLHVKHQNIMSVENAIMEELHTAEESFVETMQQIVEEGDEGADIPQSKKYVMQSIKLDVEKGQQEREKMKKMLEEYHKYKDNKQISTEANQLWENYEKGLRKLWNLSLEKYRLLTAFYDVHGSDDQKLSLKDAINKLELHRLKDELKSGRESLKGLLTDIQVTVLLEVGASQVPKRKKSRLCKRSRRTAPSSSSSGSD